SQPSPNARARASSASLTAAKCDELWGSATRSTPSISSTRSPDANTPFSTSCSYSTRFQRLITALDPAMPRTLAAGISLVNVPQRGHHATQARRTRTRSCRCVRRANPAAAAGCSARRSATARSRRSDLRVAAAARLHPAPAALGDPAQLLQDLLAVRDAARDAIEGLADQEQRGARHQDRRLARRA